MAGYLIKLVRDRVDKLKQPAESIAFKNLGQATHVKCLREKLMEEATEYLLNPCEEELADVYEAVRALAAVDLGLADENPDGAIARIAMRALEKRRERGGFDLGTGMFAQFEARE